MRVRSLGWEDPLEKEMATHSSIFAWIIPWTEEPGGLQPWGCRELDTTEQLENEEIHFNMSFTDFETYQKIGNSYVPSALDVDNTCLDIDSVQCWAPRESRKRDRTPSQPRAVSVRCSSSDRWL